MFVCALVAGFGFGIWGFTELPGTGYRFGGALWETLRLFDREYHSHEIPPGLAAAQWLLLFAFVWLSLKVIITIIAPDLISDLQVRLLYRGHIVICGAGEMTAALVDGNRGKKIIVLAEGENEHTRSLRHRGVKLLFCGEGFDEHFLRRAKAGVASRVWIATGDDRTNVETTRSVFSLAEGVRRKEALRCCTLIEDRDLKVLLDESRLFKYRTERFDPVIFNVDETGIKYALAMNIGRIIPARPDHAPEILLTGLTSRASLVILDLAHCLTMNREAFRFTVVECDTEKIAAFQKRYHWLGDFARIEYVEDMETVCAERRFDSVFVCYDDNPVAVKAALAIRNAICNDQPDIFILPGGPDGFAGVLELAGRGIFPVDTFREATEYVVELDPQVELHAGAAHDCWRKRDAGGNFAEPDEYHTLSAHFKQTNRSQVLDNYLRAWIAAGIKFGAPGGNMREGGEPPVFSAQEMETLAMMEHRRWTIEKLDCGWRPAARSDNRFKRRSNLVPWDELPDDEKKKDYDAIYLMIKLLITEPNENSLHPETS